MRPATGPIVAPIIVLALPAGLFQRIEAYDDIFKLTMTIRSHDG